MKSNIHQLLRQIVFLIDVTILLGACATAAPTPTKGMAEGFAIYVPASKMATDDILKINLNNLELEDRPIISLDDIVMYSKDMHQIELTFAAYKRIMALKIPTTGIPFVVCVDRHPIYGGAFWVGYSSMSFQGIVIDALDAEQNRPIRMQLSYPEAPELFTGEDHRSDPRILRSLERAGKLK